MKLGELAIEIGVKSDTKKLKETLKHMKELEAKISTQIKKEKELANATTEEEKALIKKKYALQENIKKTQDAIDKQQKFSDSVKSTVRNIRNVATAIVGTITMLDRMGNSLLKNNQSFMTFSRTTGIGVDRLNKMTTVAQLSGMNMNAEQVMSDMKNMQQRIFQLGLEGGDTKIFQLLGFNPLGMKPEQVIDKLRVRARSLSAQQISYALDQLGLSQEWVNVLVMGNKQYNRLQKKSDELNLSADQRKKLAMLTTKQQEKNMRLQKVWNEFLIQVLPYVQQILDKFIKFVQPIVESKEACEAIFKSLKDILQLMLVMKGINIFKGSLLGMGKLGLMGLGTTLGVGGAKMASGRMAVPIMKTVGAILGKNVGKIAAKAAIGTAEVGSGVGALLGGALWVSTIKDIWDAGVEIKNALQGTAQNIQEGADDTAKAEEEWEQMLQPVESSATSFLNRNIKAMFTNNFYNNPQPAGQVSSEMQTLINNYIGAR